MFVGRLMVQRDEDKEKVAEPIGDEEKRRLLQMSEIGISLDGYDDIFSDFDPRSYSERSLSDDFLAECKKAAREKTSGTIDLKFLIPSASRDAKAEETVRKRLHEHFRKHHSLLEREVKAIRRKGVLMVLAGFAMMMAATRLRDADPSGFVQELFITMLEPSGWFTTWFGFDQVLYATAQKRPDLDFYAKMARCEIHFTPY